MTKLGGREMSRLTDVLDDINDLFHQRFTSMTAAQAAPGLKAGQVATVDFANGTTTLVDVIAPTTEDIPNGIYDGQAVSLSFRDKDQLKNLTLTAALAREDIKIGDVINLSERISGGRGGALWDVVLASAVTPNTFNIVVCTGITTLALSLRLEGKSADIRQFGAKCDGTAETTGLLQAAIDTGADIHFSADDVYEARTESVQISEAERKLFLNGGTLIINQIFADALAPNYQVDLGGGLLSQGMRVATVATETTAGSDTIVMVDASTLVVGQILSSSWGVGGEFPLNGITGIEIQAINGNTVTLVSNMSGSTATLPIGLVVGNFSNAAFTSSLRGGFIVKNGEMADCFGYYYNTLASANLGGDITFEDVNFTGNGRDSFYIRQSQKLHLRRCRCVVPHDVAKTGVFLDTNSSLYITDCRDLGLGNFDSCIHILGAHTTSEVVVAGNSNVHGQTYLNPALGGFASDVLNGIFVEYTGSVNKIHIGEGTTWRHITRHLITTTVAFQSKAMVITTLKIAADNIETSLYNFNHDGVGNGISIGSFTITGCNVLKSLNYVVGGVSTTNSAVSRVEPIIADCTLEMDANGDQTTQSFQSGKIYNSTVRNGDPINVTKNIPYLDNVLLENQAIQINPTFSGEFVGGGGLLLIDNTDWPLTLANIFIITASSAGFANFYKAKSVRGDIVYDIYNFEGNVAASATVYIGNTKYSLQGDDWFIPIGSRIVDLSIGTTETADFAFATTTTATAATSATSILVTATGTGPSFRAAIGDRVNLVLDNGVVHSTTITGAYSEPSLTIPLTDALPSASASGSNVMLFRPV